MSVGRSLFSVLIICAALLPVAASASFAQESHSTGGSPPQLAQDVSLQQQVGDTADDVNDTADGVGNQVGDAANNAQDGLQDTVNDAGGQLNDTAAEAGQQVSGASDGPVAPTDEVGNDGSSSQATNSNPARGADAREVAGAGNDVSGESGEETSASSSGDEGAPRTGLLTLTGSQWVIAAVVAGLLLVGLGGFLISVRRRSHSPAG
jgi:LPXTG-motif cell wall-anchored protein